MPADLSSDHSRALVGFAPGSAEQAYHDRGLGRLSDAELVGAAASVVGVPRRDPASSFVLHAPLELAARAALLPLVDSDARVRARVRVVALAAGYDAFPAVADGAGSAEVDTAVARLGTSIDAGDLAATDAAARRVAAALTNRQLSTVLTPVIVGRTAAAAHAPIFAYHLDRRDPGAGLHGELLRPLARELARDPDQRVRWVDRWRPAPTTDAAGLDRMLAERWALGAPEHAFIHPLLMQVDAPGVADERLGPLLGPATAEGARVVLRAAARSMLEDDPSHAPYGWTHCLTLAQALVGITADTSDADVGLALAATSVAAFRGALGEVELTADRPWPGEGGGAEVRELATVAAVTHDAHVVKYVLACLDAAREDPEAAGLYFAAARRLLEVWVERGGDPSDPLG